MTEQEGVQQKILSRKFLEMPMGEEKADLAVKVFLQNPIFREEYRRATDKVKNHNKWIFYSSLLEEETGKEIDWVDENIKKTKESFDKADWENLIELTQSNMGKGMYRQQMKEYLANK